MPITLGSNIAALQAQRRLSDGSEALSRVYERLSSGQRINHASDDAAGIAIASSLNADQRVFGVALRNINDGLSALSIADGALSQLSGVVTRAKELAEQAANGVYSTTQRQALDTEAQQLALEYRRIVQTTEFNGKKLLDGSAGVLNVQVGSSGDANSRIDVGIGGYSTSVQGSGTFGAALSFVSLGRIISVQSVDINGDGKIDLLSNSDSGGGPVTFLGNGDGSFNSYIPTAASGAAIDMNGDGTLDLVSVAGSIFVSLGNGNGTFKSARSYTSSVSWSTTFGDVDGDGKTDVVQSSYTGLISVHLGNGDGSLNAEITYNSISGTRFYDNTLADLNNDGSLDLEIVNNGAIWVVLNNGNGTFKAGTSVSEPVVSAFEFKDFNGDGVRDALISGGSSAKLRLGNGDGTFQAAIATLAGGALFGGDLNGDGDLDIVDLTSPGVRVYMGNGNGTFQTGSSTSFGSQMLYGATLGDINADGVLDLATANYSDGTVSVSLQGTITTITPGISQSLPTFTLTSVSGALAALDNFSTQLTNLSDARSKIGASQSRLYSAAGAVAVARENYGAAEARIRDADIASESAELARRSILQQVAASVLAQANQQPKLALQLLRG